ncbi:hypothetical protein AB1Y20_012752 [Prymnesium parvum]|uniref:Mitochondrial import receptor subunit TOM22 homolog n=1 Tax=Prymnesium parvum TaxID=97485 RepID=A0AB34IJR0_PRYPA
MASTALTTVHASLADLYESGPAKKARRVAYHVVRASKKFVFGTGNAAWVVGTTMLVMVMPLVFEIDREQQALEWEASQGTRQAMPPPL